MMPAAKAFDPVLGVDVHLIQPPGPVPPVPIPHPFVGLLFDPVDFIPFVGATVRVNGLPRATAGTGAKGVPPHIPIGGLFVAPPSNDGELFMGSSTVLMDDDPASHMLHPVLTCQSVGMPSPPRKKAKTKPKSLVLPTSLVLPVPMGMPVLVGGPPTISMMALGMKVAFAGLGRLAKSRLGRRLRRGFKKLRQRACRNMRPGFIKCTLLRAEPVHVVTGEVVVEQEDFALPWRVPLRWTRRYGSQQARYGACGRGWETPADARLEFEPDGGVTFRDGSAGASVFAALPEPGGEPERELVAGATLGRTRDASGDEWFVVRARAGLGYWFPAPPLGTPPGAVREVAVSHVMDGCGNWLLFLRGPAGLAEVRDSSGQRVVAESQGGRVQRLDLVDPDTGALLPLVSYEYGGGAVAVDDLTAVVDALGEPYRFAYDDERRLVRHTDRVGLSFHYAYDGPGQDARCVHAWGDGGLYAYRFAWEEDAAAGVGRAHVRDSLGHVSVVEYDPDTRLPLREVDPLGGVTTWEYDGAGRCAAEVKPWGARTEWEYDAGGGVVRETGPDGAAVRTEYDGAGRPTATVDAMGHRWEQEWDVRGLLVRRTGPRGGAWRIEHGPAGDLAAVTDPLGNTTRLAHDHRGNLRETVDPLGHVTRYRVGPRGATAERVDALGHRTQYAYDGKGRLRAITDPLGQTASCEYDAEDRPRLLRDAAGHVTELVYAGLGGLVQRRSPDGTRVSYWYDTEERLIGVENQRGQRYSIARDALGRVARTIDYWGQETEHHYAGSGPLARDVDPMGRSTRYAYDAAGRLSERAYEDGVEQFAYDLNGRLVLARNADATVTFRRDAEGNVVQERRGHFAVASEYDPLGRRVRRRSSAGHEVCVAYDAAGYAAGVDLDGAALVRTRRDSCGRPVEDSLIGGLTRAMAWDAAGRLVAQGLRSEARSVATRAYRYDAVGQLVERRDGAGGGLRFAYDPLGRVVDQLDPAGRLERFGYDPAGDLLRDATRAPAHDGRRPTRTAHGAGATYEFDAAGNLTRRVRADGEARFTWSGANRLVAATTERGVEVTFRYDALGRRVAKVADGRTTAFYWDGDHLLADEVEVGHAREFVNRPGTWEVLASANGRVCLYENDQVGLPHSVVDASTGGVVWAAAFNAHGSIAREFADGYDNPVRFQGQYHDRETGLHYNRFRYYDPGAGAFIGQDPLGLVAGSNLYAYAPNAWSWADPYGLTAGPPCTPHKGSDPLVPELVAEIERRYPGHVIAVEQKIHRVDGTVLTDFDIVTANAVIQVKSGGGKGMAKQIATSKTATDKVVIGYGPDLKGSVVKEIQRAGDLVTTDVETLLAVIKP